MANQIRHLGTVGAPRAESADDPVLEFAQGRIEPVADLVFHEIPELLHGVEFRALGRQRQQTEVGGQPGIPRPDVKAGLILDDDVHGLRFAPADLLGERAHARPDRCRE